MGVDTYTCAYTQTYAQIYIHTHSYTWTYTYKYTSTTNLPHGVNNLSEVRALLQLDHGEVAA